MRLERRLPDPVDRKALERALSTPPFEDLVNVIIGEPIQNSSKERLHSTEFSLGSRPRHRVLLTVVPGVAAVAVLVVSLLFVVGPNALNHVVRTRWQSGHVLAAGTRERKGTWRLADQALTGTWEQDTSGPPPGSLECPSPSACYVMAGRYVSSLAGAPMLSESLYMSDDLGKSWMEFPMPAGFASTSPLSCASPTECFAGGTYEGSAVLLSTDDGGHSFLLAPLPSSVGKIYELSCTSSGFCGALAANSANTNEALIDATFLSTSDRGATFSDRPIVSGDSMQLVSCSSSTQCLVVGNDDQYMNDWTAGVVAVTSDGGSTWQLGSLPAGFGVSYLSQLSCSDAQHCSLVGNIASATDNGIATTTNGGMTWTIEPLPASVPLPTFTGLSCPSDTECWAAGSDAVPQKIGNVMNEGSSVLLGTTDGGASWSPVSFTVPTGSPNYLGQEYLGIGPISCPSSNVCMALGAGAQSSPSVPVYSLVSSAVPNT